MRLKVAQHDLLQDVLEQVNLPVALDQLLHRGAELLELRGREMPQPGQSQVHQRQLGMGRDRLHLRQHAQRFLAHRSRGRGGQFVQLLAAAGLVVAQQEGINQRAGARAPRRAAACRLAGMATRKPSA